MSLSRMFTTAADLEKQRALFQERLSRFPQDEAEAAPWDQLSRRR
jgi:hypothetical protein